MGHVFRAENLQTGQLVAVKVLHTKKGDHALRFAREAKILAGIDNPLVVRHIEHGTLDSGEPYLVMEWLDGEDLAMRLARGRLGISDSLVLATVLANALDVLHTQGILHRDLKPSNVFLVDGRVDQVKLLDLGLARIDTSTVLTD